MVYHPLANQESKRRHRRGSARVAIGRLSYIPRFSSESRARIVEPMSVFLSFPNLPSVTDSSIVTLRRRY